MTWPRREGGTGLRAGPLLSSRTTLVGAFRRSHRALRWHLQGYMLCPRSWSPPEEPGTGRGPPNGVEVPCGHAPVGQDGSSHGAGVAVRERQGERAPHRLRWVGVKERGEFVNDWGDNGMVDTRAGCVQGSGGFPAAASFAFIAALTAPVRAGPTK